ncbi:MAG: Dihydrolipoyllysine-residue acetyltransferase component of pyruvate dehydrogenase complex [Myxococcota bacterium]|nr:Dihydrolipoyllysine-residue acetyltransferase component of pyruvate dehydrogenase complex [Myxococcota bacterium]
MATDVIMPQLGESIAEGTIVTWLKKSGDSVKRDENLLIVSTDKVEAEIPSPAAGVLLEILVPEGKTVPINTVLARLGQAGETAARAPAAAPAPAPAPVAPAAPPPAPAVSAAPASGGKTTDVIMPQLGESIAEGTIVTWLKKPGDSVKRDENLLVVSTDKVEAEIPSPAAGVLLEILVPEGKTVPINTVLARLGEPGAKPGAAAPAPAAAAKTEPVMHLDAPTAAFYEGAPKAAPAPAPAPAPAASPPAAAASGSADAFAKRLPGESEEAFIKRRTSPLVRRLAKEQGVNLALIPGTGLHGRVTRADFDRAAAQGLGKGPSPASAPMASAAAAAPAPAPASVPAPAPAAAWQPGEDVEIVPMTPMRRSIAEHMVASKRTSAHVTSFTEVDLHAVDKIRLARKDAFKKAEGFSLTYMPFIARAACVALREHPIVNSSVDGDKIIYKKRINLGIAVALENAGLIVPVVPGADTKNTLGIARAISEVAAKARDRKLSPGDVAGGTFTITNPGVFGSTTGTPIINQPQVAILGTGAVIKRPWVVEDMISIRPIMWLSLSYDHRIIDGATAGMFLNRMKELLENWTEQV